MPPSPDSLPELLARLRAGELHGATRLDLRHGGLRELPPELLALAGTLEVLDVSDNRLTQWPPGLAALQRLELVRLSANRFATLADALPMDLLTLPRLAWLAHGGNPCALAAEAQAERAAR